MSFKQNDNNENTIHLGNYEEFFVLYMDNELTDGQMKMVDDFLLAHPDLQAEFEILAGTKLPSEEFSFNKEDLFSGNMKLNVVSEDLLLYIDKELPADKARAVELEIAANSDYRMQHQVLLAAKLDAAEVVAHPNKKELYRRTERRIGFQPWMRIAAAAVVIAAMGVVYFNSGSGSAGNDPSIGSEVAVAPKANKSVEKNSEKKETPENGNTVKNDLVENGAANKNAVRNVEKTNTISPEKENDNIPDDVIAYHNDPAQNTNVTIDAGEPAITVDISMVDGATARTINVPGKDLNISDVTTPGFASYNPQEPAPIEKKGSVKGFLRKATRMIEKRTGIDATNDDGKLLIGAVALSLK